MRSASAAPAAPEYAETDAADDQPAPPARTPPTRRLAANDPADGVQWSGPAPRQTPAKPINVFGEVNGAAPVGSDAAGDTALAQHTFIDQGYDADVAVDPSGKWLAFASTRHNDAPDIYLQRTDGTAVTQLTNDSNPDAYPTFNPAGNQIAFCSSRGGAWQIYVMDVEGRNVKQVTSGPTQAVHPSFSPDGRRICYMALGARGGQWEIWIANLQTNEKKIVGQGLFPSWRPDPTVDRIAFQRAPQRGSRQFSLWTMDIAEGEGGRLTEIASSPNAAIVSPGWSHDGKKLAFGTVASVAPAAGKASKKAKSGQAASQQDIWVVDSDGANKRRLTDGHAASFQPVWAASGRVFFISNRSGAECIWSIATGDAGPMMADAAQPRKPRAKAAAATPDEALPPATDPFANADAQEAAP